MKVGFIGLGLMGSPMAKNILAVGFPLTIFNRTASKTKILHKMGVKVTVSPEALAENSNVVITMVTAGKDVEEILFGKNGVVAGAKKGTVVIDMSTIGPTYAKTISSKLMKKGIDFIDAPVTGGIQKAESGELTIFIGGKEKVYKRVRKVLQAMGKFLIYMGETGSGQAMKIVNNQLHSAGIIALSEGMLLSYSLGLKRNKVVQALTTSPAMSPTMSIVAPNYETAKYPVRFSIANLSKDVTLAKEEARKVKLDLQLMETTEKIYRKAVKSKLGKEDFSAIIKIIEK